jgi:MoxR-like ATPase
MTVRSDAGPARDRAAAPMPWAAALAGQIGRQVVGQQQLVHRLTVALLAGGHVLLEGLPGLAKTLIVKTLAQACQLSFQRLQFTPDLLPADLIGTLVYNPKTLEFAVHKGPVFANIVLADEINRAPAKVQSALLEVMQERQVTIAGETHKVPRPFLVMATQNPIETEGTYPLPEAQVDRFMMKVLVDYPSDEEEFVIVERVIGPPVAANAIATTDELALLQARARKVYVDPSLIQYAVKLVSATRTPEKHGLKDMRRFITFGASPRASINLTEGARALALLRGRSYALPEDMTALAPDVLRHRVTLSYEGLSEGLTPDGLIERIMRAVPAPAKVMEHEKLVA